MDKMEALPQAAELTTGPLTRLSWFMLNRAGMRLISVMGWLGRKGVRCYLTPIGPMPGPPPP